MLDLYETNNTFKLSDSNILKNISLIEKQILNNSIIIENILSTDSKFEYKNFMNKAEQVFNNSGVNKSVIEVIETYNNTEKPKLKLVELSYLKNRKNRGFDCSNLKKKGKCLLLL